MEKNRITPVKAGKGIRMSYSRSKEVLEMPNLIEVQRDSYEWFLTTGLKEVLDDISPIEDYAQNLSLEFIDFKLCEEDKNIFAYTRSLNGDTILVICNFYDKEVNFKFNNDFNYAEVLLSNYKNSSTLIENLNLRPYEAIMFRVK